MAKKRTKAQRSKAAKESWARRRAAAALKEVPKFAGSPPPDLRPDVPVYVPPAPAPVTVSVTHEGRDYYIGINNNGSLHRVKVTAETLKSMALDALRII